MVQIKRWLQHVDIVGNEVMGEEQIDQGKDWDYSYIQFCRSDLEICHCRAFDAGMSTHNTTYLRRAHAQEYRRNHAHGDETLTALELHVQRPRQNPSSIRQYDTQPELSELQPTIMDNLKRNSYLSRWWYPRQYLFGWSALRHSRAGVSHLLAKLRANLGL